MVSGVIVPIYASSLLSYSSAENCFAVARTETNEFLSQCNNAAIILGGFGGSIIQFLAYLFPKARWLFLVAAILSLVGGITGLAGAPTTVKKIIMSFGGVCIWHPYFTFGASVSPTSGSYWFCAGCVEGMARNMIVCAW
jgi:hypothetical protein